MDPIKEYNNKEVTKKPQAAFQTVLDKFLHKAPSSKDNSEPELLETPTSRRVTRSVSKKPPNASATSADSSEKQEDSEVNQVNLKVKQPSTLKRKRSSGYAPPSRYAHLTNNLTDTLQPDLICVFIGLNPGLTTATTGHAYAHPSNLFWRLLASSSCTPRRCLPSETHDLPTLYGLGNTNIVERPTANGAELSRAEMDAGVHILDSKVEKCRPEAVAIVGKSIWESIWRVRKGKAITKGEFRYGWQDDNMRMGRPGLGSGKSDGWKGARVFVATTTSGLAASMGLAEKEAIWRQLGEWVEQRRAEKGLVGQRYLKGGVIKDSK